MRFSSRHPSRLCTVLIVAATLALTAKGQQSEHARHGCMYGFVVGGRQSCCNSDWSAGTALTGDYSTYARQNPVAFVSLLGSMPVEVQYIRAVPHPACKTRHHILNHAGAKGASSARWGNSTAEEQLGEGGRRVVCSTVVWNMLHWLCTALLEFLACCHAGLQSAWGRRVMHDAPFKL